MLKNLTLGLLLAGTAFAGPKSNYLQKHNFVDLTVDAPVIRLNIPYPGYQGRSCHVELRANHGFSSSEGLKALQEQIEVAEVGFHGEHPVALPSTNGTVLTYHIKSLDTYVVWIDVKTKSGKSLQEVIKAALPEQTIGAKATPRVIAQLRDCK